MVFHVLNRGVGRMRLFYKDADFEAFERIVDKTPETRPMRIRAYCLRHVNQPQIDAELAAIRCSVQRGQPFGDDRWVQATSECLGLESTLRARGRPKKQPAGNR